MLLPEFVSISFNLSSAVPDSVTKEKREKEMEGKRGESVSIQFGRTKMNPR